MRDRYFFCVAVLVLCPRGELGHARQSREGLPVEASAEAASPFAEFPTAKTGANPDCLEWKGEACRVCGINSVRNFSVQNKTKTPLLLCRGMKPGPVKISIETHAEPTLPGLWEVELGLGYQTSARSECPHQFIASNNPPLLTGYEVGPLTIEAEIPPDGTI